MNAITLDFDRPAHKLHFNTGRWYTAHGQRLAVWVVPSVGQAYFDAACFVDFDATSPGTSRSRSRAPILCRAAP
jgi:hypothetical protein